MTVELIQYAVVAVLIVACILDAKAGKIPNWLIYVLFALFAVKAAVFPESVDLVWQIGVAIGVFIFGFILFTTNVIPAGSVKLISALMLFMPLHAPWSLFGLFLISLFGCGLLSFIVRLIFENENSEWAVINKRVLPMAWPITTMGLLGMFWL